MEVLCPLEEIELEDLAEHFGGGKLVGIDEREMIEGEVGEKPPCSAPADVGAHRRGGGVEAEDLPDHAVPFTECHPWTSHGDGES